MHDTRLHHIKCSVANCHFFYVPCISGNALTRSCIECLFLIWVTIWSYLVYQLHNAKYSRALMKSPMAPKKIEESRGCIRCSNPSTFFDTHEARKPSGMSFADLETVNLKSASWRERESDVYCLICEFRDLARFYKAVVTQGDKIYNTIITQLNKAKSYYCVVIV